MEIFLHVLLKSQLEINSLQLSMTDLLILIKNLDNNKILDLCAVKSIKFEDVLYTLCMDTNNNFNEYLKKARLYAIILKNEKNFQLVLGIIFDKINMNCFCKQEEKDFVDMTNDQHVNDFWIG